MIPLGACNIITGKAKDIPGGTDPGRLLIPTPSTQKKKLSKLNKLSNPGKVNK